MFLSLHKVKVFGSCCLPIQHMDHNPCFSLGLPARRLPTAQSCCSPVGSVWLPLALCWLLLWWPLCQDPSLFELPGWSVLTHEETVSNPVLNLHCVHLCVRRGCRNLCTIPKNISDKVGIKNGSLQPNKDHSPGFAIYFHHSWCSVMQQESHRIPLPYACYALLALFVSAVRTGHVGHAIFVPGYLYHMTLCRAFLPQPLMDLAELLSSENLTAQSALTLKECSSRQTVVVRRFGVPTSPLWWERWKIYPYRLLPSGDVSSLLAPRWAPRTEKQCETGWFGANLLYFVYVAAVSAS